MVLLPLAIAFAGPAIFQALPSVWGYMASYMMSSTVIPAQDLQLQRIFRDWLKKKLIKVPERSVTAQSPLHASNYSENDSVCFQDRNTFQFFRHNKRFFVVTSNGNGSDIIIWTFGWTPQAIKDILVEITEEEERLNVQQTHILTADHGNWMVQKSRSQRALDSIYLDAQVKQDLLEDIAEYLEPSTRVWYQDRGIPYRRGYLFYGKPDTGKSSLALALAGRFKTNVFSLSLLDPKISDSSLMALFQRLPPGCICLLEDVDSAGLGREINGQTQDKSGPGKRGMKGTSTPTSRVTLSGLLNAIDGASAPEGHLLLMTTNCPESLDEALIRAGRIDVKVEFKHANQDQLSAIFLAMYRTRVPENVTEVRSKAIDKENEQVSMLADRFVELVPEYRFSPAQLQDYFLLHKKSAKDAVENVQIWIEKENLSKSTSAETKVNAVEEAEWEPAPKPMNRSSQPHHLV